MFIPFEIVDTKKIINNFASKSPTQTKVLAYYNFKHLKCYSDKLECCEIMTCFNNKPL